MKHLNLGCGFSKMVNAHNVDAYPICSPDEVVDLNKTPFPWESETWDKITAYHVMEHLEDWWAAFCECVRICKTGGSIEIHVPHPSSDSAMTYRDHLHVIDMRSFDGISNGPSNTVNAWFESHERVPVILRSYNLVPIASVALSTVSTPTPGIRAAILY